MTRSGSRFTRLRDHYGLHLQMGLALALILLVTAAQVDLQPGEAEFAVNLETQEVVNMEEIKQTEQNLKAPPPPKAPVPVEVPNDVVLEQEDINFDASLDLSASLDTAGGPPGMPDETSHAEENVENEIFVVVEEQPTLVGGIAALQKTLNYPSFAQKAGIEGRVFVEFVVDEKGDVQDAAVSRGVHKLLDRAALDAVRQMTFRPGKQRGRPVMVQMTLPVNFELKNGQRSPW